MSDKPWKQLERHCALLIGGRRYEANTGHKVDIESDSWIGQCKLVQDKHLTLEKLTQLVEETERAGQTSGKHAAVFVKVRRGKGTKSPVLVVMSEEVFAMIALPTKETP